MMAFLKTALDWIAMGCLISDLLVLVLLIVLLPIAKESNATLVKISVEVQDNTRALLTNQAAIQQLLKERHE
jgi:hypothetical protein